MSSWKEILDMNFFYTEYGLQGSDFRTVGPSQLTSHEQNGKADTLKHPKKRRHHRDAIKPARGKR